MHFTLLKLLTKIRKSNFVFYSGWIAAVFCGLASFASFFYSDAVIDDISLFSTNNGSRVSLLFSNDDSKAIEDFTINIIGTDGLSKNQLTEKKLAFFGAKSRDGIYGALVNGNPNIILFCYSYKAGPLKYNWVLMYGKPSLYSPQIKTLGFGSSHFSNTSCKYKIKKALINNEYFDH